MADKWADYLIVGVRFNAADTHIESVQICTDDAESTGPIERATRAQVVSADESGTSFCTATKSGGNWQKGALLKVITIEGTKFIKSNDDGIKRDNLDELPRF